MLLTRAPLYSWYCYHFLVRLACVRHAASVDSEPGSNSRLKPVVVPSDGGRNRFDSSAHHCARRVTYLVRMIKPNLIVSHDWHVQPYCQRSLRAVRLSGALLDRGPGCDARVSSNLLRLARFSLSSGHRHFCANFLNLSKFRCRVKLRFCRNQDLQLFHLSAGRFSCLFDRHSGRS